MSKSTTNRAKNAFTFGFFASAGHAAFRAFSKAAPRVLIVTSFVMMPLLLAGAVHGALGKHRHNILRCVCIIAFPFLVVGSAYSVTFVGAFLSQVFGWIIAGDSHVGFVVFMDFLESASNAIVNNPIYVQGILPPVDFWSTRILGGLLTKQEVFQLAGTMVITGPMMVTGLWIAIGSYFRK